MVTVEDTGPASFRLILTEKGAGEIEKKGTAEKDTDETPD